MWDEEKNNFQGRHPEGLLVPKDLARSGAIAAVLDIRSTLDASQAQHDASRKIKGHKFIADNLDGVTVSQSLQSWL